MTANTMLQDIRFMENHIRKGNFYISSIEEQGLIAQGWIIYAGLGYGSGTEPGGNLYEYTLAAKEYCKCG